MPSPQQIKIREVLKGADLIGLTFSDLVPGVAMDNFRFSFPITAIYRAMQLKLAKDPTYGMFSCKACGEALVRKLQQCPFCGKGGE